MWRMKEAFDASATFLALLSLVPRAPLLSMACNLNGEYKENELHKTDL